MEKKQVKALVDEIIKCYKSDTATGLQVTIQFFVNACSSQIRVEDYDSKDFENIIKSMEEDVIKRNNIEFPLMGKERKVKKTCNSYSEFIHLLVKQCQNSILYDGCLIQNICSFLAKLSVSRIRGFRHASTLAGLNLLTILLQVAHEVETNMNEIQGQWDKEKTNDSDEIAIARLDLLESNLNELEDNMQELQNMVWFLFGAIVVHRLRDVCAEIRVLCCENLGSWIRTYHGTYLQDKYLKYIGFLLYDSSPDVRMSCVQALLPLYASAESCMKLEQFTKKFLKRLVCMTLDKQINVSVHTFKILTFIYRCFGSELLSTDSENLYLLVFSKYLSVAQAAGEFLLLVFEEQKKKDNSSLLENIVCFFSEAGYPDHARCLVDALWDNCDELRNWPEMSRLGMVQNDTGNLPAVKIIVSCIECAVSGKSVTGDAKLGQKKRQQLEKVKEEFEHNRQNITEQFLTSLPEMMLSNICDVDSIKCLLTIPLHFKMEMFGMPQFQEKLNTLLRIIKKIFVRYADEEVVVGCTNVFKFFHKEDAPTFNTTDILLNILAEKTIKHYKKSMIRWCQMDKEQPMENEVLISWTRKLCCLYKCSDMSNHSLLKEATHSIFNYLNQVQSVPDKVLVLLAKICFFELMWRLKKLKDQHEDTEESVRCLAEDVQTYFQVLRTILTTDKVDVKVSVKDEIFLILCDFLHAFGEKATRAHGFAVLTCAPDSQLQSDINRLIQERLLADEDSFNETSGDGLLKTRSNMCKMILAGYCKLIIYDVLPLTPVPYLLLYYCKFQDCEDIVIYMMDRLLEIESAGFGLSIIKSLKVLYSYIRKEENWHEGLGELKALCNKIYGALKKHPQKSEAAIQVIHLNGINYVAEQNDVISHLSFLELLSEFCKQISDGLSKVIFNHLEQKIPAPDTRTAADEWSSYKIYKTALAAADKKRKVEVGNLKSDKKKRETKDRKKVTPTSSETKKMKTKTKNKKSKGRGTLEVFTHPAPQPTAASTPMPPLSVTPSIEDTSVPPSQILMT
ncbi:cohesin subunit SA-2-like [Schistocerca gregaria]|uniref:cohesin subunit SA-2-like n=1 Tax=Schistocerca gregaria TaxID=7010 RepID=UPI00211E61E6|nr:cohesin subunit SA-2-like [Schistocerca gregaria]